MAENKQKNYTLDCAITYALSIFESKWKWLIIYALSEEGTIRYGELKSCLPDITHKMLSQQLKALEKMNLVLRKAYHQIPPKVEYSLTKKGTTLLPIIDLLCEWGYKNRPAAAKARQ